MQWQFHPRYVDCKNGKEKARNNWNGKPLTIT
jgi:hypothetical protein